MVTSFSSSLFVSPIVFLWPTASFAFSLHTLRHPAVAGAWGYRHIAPKASVSVRDINVYGKLKVRYASPSAREFVC